MAESASKFLIPLPSGLPAPEPGALELAEKTQGPGTVGYISWKPTIDAFLAALFLVLAAPLTLLAAALVKFTSRGPAFYTQERVGRLGKTFVIYKLRTMYTNSESGTGAVWSKTGDPRVTPLGRVLRATHIDEFPQLLNVLHGQMSLCGPRPERPEIVEYLRQRIDGYTERLYVRPGITGLAQVRLPPDTCLGEVRRKLICDRHYISHLTASLDLRIMICTALLFFGVPLRLSRNLLRIPNPLHPRR